MPRSNEKCCQTCAWPVNFVSFYLFFLTFSMQLKDANDKNHTNTLVCWDQGKIMSDLNISHGKMSDCVLFPLVGFTLVKKLRNFNFEIR